MAVGNPIAPVTMMSVSMTWLPPEGERAQVCAMAMDDCCQW